MTAIEFSLICLGFFVQVFVFFMGVLLGVAAAKRADSERKKDEARRHYEAALRFWHAPHNVEKN